MKKLCLFFCLLGLLLGVSCDAYKRAMPTNYANEYAIDQDKESIRVKAWHSGSDSSIVFVEMPQMALTSYDNFVVNIDVTDSTNAIIDTALLILHKEDFSQRIFAHKIRALSGQNYQVNVHIKTEDKKYVFRKKIILWRESDFTEQHFILQNEKTNSVIFDSYIAVPTTVNILYRGNKNTDYSVYYEATDTLLPPPPFSEKNLKIKSLPTNYQETNNSISIDKKGFYTIQIQLDNKTHSTELLGVNDDFPKLTAANDLLKTLRFITKKSEYEKLINADQQRKAIDAFWLEKAGSYERGKVLIKSFYGRIQKANKLYTHRQHGWMTDRGLIYIIYGPPHYVHRKDKTETWTYSNTTDSGDLSFYFDQQLDNSFRLQRSHLYKESWDYMVFTWRNGIVAKW